MQIRPVRFVAQSMTVTDTAIQVQAHLNQVLEYHGSGIYTVILRGKRDHMTEPTPLLEQVIFWKIRPAPSAPY